MALPEKCFEFSSTTDKAALSTQVLVEASMANGGVACHFENYYERFSDEVQEYILRKPQKFNQNQLGDFALSL